MENNLENKLSMYQKVQFFLTHHAAETAGIPMVATLREELNEKVDGILALLSSAATDITGYAADKKTKRADLSAKILKLSTAIVAFASMNGDRILVEKYHKTLNGLGEMRENDLYVFGKTLINEVTPMLADLAPFGLQEDDLLSANSASLAYFEALNNPKTKIKERSKTFEELVISMTGTDALLQDKLDKVMAIYQATNLSLYRGYLGARSIDDTGSEASADYTGIVATASIAVVAEIPYLSGRSFDIENTGVVDLLFALSTTPSELNGTPVYLPAKSSVMKKSQNLNPDKAAVYLLFKNADENVSGSYKVWEMGVG